MNDELIARIKQRADVPTTRIDNSDTDVPPPFPPARATEVKQAEQLLGFSLPFDLADLYIGVGNGGFGPGYGLIGLPGGVLDDGDKSIVDLYHAYHIVSPDDPTWRWPDRLVPVCNWGCAIYSCVDCDCGSVVTFDPGEQSEGEPLSRAFAQSHPSVVTWFEDWVNGIRLWDKMYERVPGDDLIVANPFTEKKATIPKLRLRR